MLTLGVKTNTEDDITVIRSRFILSIDDVIYQNGSLVKSSIESDCMRVDRQFIAEQLV